MRWRVAGATLAWLAPAVVFAQTVVVQPASPGTGPLPPAPRVAPSADGRSTLVRPYASPNVTVIPGPGTTVVQPQAGQSVTVVQPPRR